MITGYSGLSAQRPSECRNDDENAESAVCAVCLVESSVEQTAGGGHQIDERWTRDMCSFVYVYL